MVQWWLIILFNALGGSVLWIAAAHGENCTAPALSTVARAECQERSLQKATNAMAASLTNALAAAKASRQKDSAADFGPEIEAAQAAWLSWMDKECELEANATMGSAAAFVEPACKSRLTLERVKMLDELTTELARD